MKKENIEFLNGIESVLSHRPSHLLWLVPMLIGSLVVLIILWLIFSKIDVIATSLGKTIPSSKMVLIQPKDLSIIDKIYVKNGQIVNKGDLLVEFKDKIENFENNSMNAKYKGLISEKLFLDNYISYIKSEKYNKKLSDERLSLEELHRTNTKLETNISSYQTEYLSLQIKVDKINFEKKMVASELRKQQKILPFKEHQLEQLKQLVEKGLESEISLQDLETEFIEQEENIKIKQAEKSKLQAQLKIAQKELEQFKNNTLKEMNKKQNEIINELTALLP